MITLLPRTQSWATWVQAINNTLLPISVEPLATVPRLMVTDSRIVTLLPIVAVVSSPPNFKSCGISPIEQL
jgi:hypothetical protein